MDVSIDPEGRELEALQSVAGDFAGKRVLEVGCGDGRLTWHIAERAASVVGIDPDEDSIVAAREKMPARLRDRVELCTSGFDQFASPGPFDLVILSWSL